MSPRAPGLGVNAQRRAASAGLGGVTLTRHVTLAVVQAGAASQLVAAEALSPILCPSQTVPLRVAVGRALGVGDFVVTNVRKFDPSQDAGIHVVRVAAFIGPADRDRARGSGRGR